MPGYLLRLAKSIAIHRSKLFYDACCLEKGSQIRRIVSLQCFALALRLLDESDEELSEVDEVSTDAPKVGLDAIIATAQVSELIL